LGKAAPAGIRLASPLARFAAKIAPNSDTPTEPPVERNRVVPEVATPRLR
jgi:hypothetical protein